MCDNDAYVNKLQELMEDPYQFRNNEPEALTIILQCLPNHFTIQHVFGHQNDKTKWKDLSKYANLNINADHLATTSAFIPINTHIKSIPFEVYANKNYIHNKVDHQIRQQSRADEARDFLMEKYKWLTKTINSIDWESQRDIINKLPNALQRTSLRFIHHRFPTGKFNLTSNTDVHTELSHQQTRS